MGIRLSTTTFAFLFLSAASLFAREQSILARITVYWPGEGQIRACSNGARLRNGHCAVDPKRIPYGSHLFFPDAECVAVDSGPGVVKRTAARACGRTAAQREAIVIDRFFESKEAALSWSNAHPQFMTVQVQSPESARHVAETITADGTAKARSGDKNSPIGATKPGAKQHVREALPPEFDVGKVELHLPLDSFLRSPRRT
jgi:3D (Asp-Asp-Asp) domain-containing protein